MKRRFLAIVSLILCVASMLSSVGCSIDDGGDSSESATDAYSESITESLKKTEKKTEKRTNKKTTAKKETELIPGVSTTKENLTSKTYNFANMSLINQSYFKFLGRTKVSQDGLIFDTSCATLEFQGYMTGDVVIEIQTKKNHDYGNSFFTVYIDGKRSETRFEVGSNKTAKLTIASFTGKYFHNIKIVKQTEFKWSLATVKSLEIKGILSKAPKEKELYVEFFGDSLTAAYGNIGKAGVSNGDSPKYEDGTQSYAYIFANAIGADYSMMSRSAAGINQCWSNSPIIDYHKKFSKDRSSEAFDIANARKPDLIVIHLGANDYNVARENDVISNSEKRAFVDGGKKLINYLNDGYGKDIPIIWAYDPNEGFPTEVKEIINSFGGESAGYYTIALPYTDKGADAHPTVKEHEKHAKQLQDLIVSKNILT
jgi:hypothetical protein